MIHEYALEPELVATWGNRHDFRYFVEKFGLGQPRIVSRYPKRWKRLVWDAFRDDNELERKRLEELVVRLCEHMVYRKDAVWNPENPWLENARTENARVPFHAILARENPSRYATTLTPDDINGGSALWAVPQGRTVARSPQEMAQAVAPMLRIARRIIFVDPRFGAENARHRRPLEAFLRSVLAGRPNDQPERIELHGSINTRATREFFESECRERLPGCIPGGLVLLICRLRGRAGRETPHNRFILTDIGGVAFARGLDDGAEGENDEIMLLERAQFEIRWRQHAEGAPEYELDGAAIQVASP